MTNTDFELYLGKNIKITCIDGQVLTGCCCGYTPANDTDNGIGVINIPCSKRSQYGIDENEIESIEILK